MNVLREYNHYVLVQKNASRNLLREAFFCFWLSFYLRKLYFSTTALERFRGRSTSTPCSRAIK